MSLQLYSGWRAMRNADVFSGIYCAEAAAASAYAGAAGTHKLIANKLIILYIEHPSLEAGNSRVAFALRKFA